MQDCSGREKALQVVVMIRLRWSELNMLIMCSVSRWQARGEVPGPHTDCIVCLEDSRPLRRDEMAMASEGKGHRKGQHKWEVGREEEREGRCRSLPRVARVLFTGA